MIWFLIHSDSDHGWWFIGTIIGEVTAFVIVVSSLKSFLLMYFGLKNPYLLCFLVKILVFTIFILSSFTWLYYVIFFNATWCLILPWNYEIIIFIIKLKQFIFIIIFKLTEWGWKLTSLLLFLLMFSLFKKRLTRLLMEFIVAVWFYVFILFYSKIIFTFLCFFHENSLFLVVLKNLWDIVFF